MTKIFPIEALKDNYIWCLHNAIYCAVVDPGEANPVYKALKENNLTLGAILVTHHHYDHTDGISTLLEDFQVPVIGPKEIVQVTAPLQPNQQVTLNFLELTLSHLAIPGHTLEHVAYYSEGMAFTGDTLFTGGCGRIFEGTPEQMYNSLLKLKSLPDDTLIYCGHEYTENNLKFALNVEPLNKDIQSRLENTIKSRRNLLSTVPASLALEKKTNPFLRCEHPNVIEAASKYYGKPITGSVEVLKVIREWKNVF